MKAIHFLCIFLTAMASIANSQPQVDDECNLVQWTGRLESDKAAAVAELVAGQPETFKVIEGLLGLENSDAIDGAIRACQTIGPAAAPLVPNLVPHLHKAESWLTQDACCRALMAIGVGGADVMAALLVHMRTSEIPRLRAVCSRAYGQFQSDRGKRFLEMADSPEAGDLEWIVESVCDIGEPMTEALIEALASESRAKQVAQVALPRFGWRAVTRLEQAGYPELAQAALREGPLRRIAYIEEYVLQATPDEPPARSLPTIEWESGYGHGYGLTLYRAYESERGLDVDRIRLRMPRRNEDSPTEVSVHTTSIARSRGLELTRQLSALGKLELRRTEGSAMDRRRGRSSGNFDARVRAVVANTTIIDESFCDYPSTENVASRFRAEAAVDVLYQAYSESEWTERSATARDREWLESRCIDIDKDVWWVADRLRSMSDSLKVR